MSLKNTIELLASTLADGLLRAIRDASLDEIFSETGRGAPSQRGRAARSSTRTPKPRHRGRRLARRSPEEVAKVVVALVDALQNAKRGMSSKELQEMLSIEKKALVRPIAEALAAKKIRKTGQKRATKYFVR